MPAVVSFAAVLVVAFALWCRCRRRRSDRTAAGSEFEDNGARAAVCSSSRRHHPFLAESLPAFAYARDSDGTGGGRECSVCLGAVREGEMVRRLPACMHVYHAECIDRWLAAHRTCPLCRLELIDPCKVEAVAPVVGDPPDQP